MKFDARGGISILEICVYVPLLCLAVLICLRHGFQKNSGWVYTVALSLIRIIGACCQLALYSNTSAGLLKATIILDSIGLSPLLLAALGLLFRFADSANTHSQTPLTTRHFRVCQLLIIVGLIVSISGVNTNIDPNNLSQTAPSTSSKVGVILYIVAYAVMILFTFVLTIYAGSAASSERPLMLGIYLALPFLAVRLVYSILTVFLHNSTFNLIDGSMVTLVCMRDLEEFIVVGIFICVGLKVNKLDRALPDYRTGERERRNGKHNRPGFAGA